MVYALALPQPLPAPLKRIAWRLFVQPPLIPLLIVTLFVDGFWTLANLRVLIDAIASDGMIVIGMTIVMIAAGFDLSVGAVAALAGVVAVVLLPYGLPVAIAGAVLAGLAVGICNGTLITKLGINPFIATLAMMVMVRGGLLTATDTRPVVGLEDHFLALGGGSWPVPFMALLVVLVLAHLLMRQRAFGRHVYALGADERAARMAGLKVNRLKLQCYALSGALAGLAGLFLAARLGTGSPIIGETTALTAAAAALLGGASLRGGQGSIAGAFAGLLFLGALVNLMNRLDVPAYDQRIAIGAILIAMVVLEGTLLRLRPRA